MFVYIARHAWAYEFGDPRWPDDSLREVEPEGAERFMRVVETLAERGFAPEAVATSPYARCRQTAEIIARYTPAQPAVTDLDALAPGSSLTALLDWSRAADCKQICWVGHATDVGLLTAELIGDGDANVRFAKGAIAAVRFDGHFERGAGELYWHATAKSLGL
jgi:phosphohistidine phosphatase SixA